MGLLLALLSAGAWVSGWLIARASNPVRSVFFLVSVFLHVSGLLLLLGLEYFALLQLLVYVGALAVLFLFVVMLLDIPAAEVAAYQRGAYPASGLLLVCLVVALGFLNPAHVLMVEGGAGETVFLPLASSWDRLAELQEPVQVLGIDIFGLHGDLLLLAAYVLLVAMVGAVALTLRRRPEAALADVYGQHRRDLGFTVVSWPASVGVGVSIKAVQDVKLKGGATP